MTPSRAPAARLELPATLARMDEVGAFVRAQLAELELGSAAVLVELSLHELATNATRHGAATRLELTATRAGGGLALTLGDDGTPFDPLAAEPAPLGEARAGGYGLGIVQQSARELGFALAYARRDGWNRLELRFPAAGVADPADGSPGSSEA